MERRRAGGRANLEGRITVGGWWEQMASRTAAAGEQLGTVERKLGQNRQCRKRKPGVAGCLRGGWSLGDIWELVGWGFGLPR